MKAGRDDREITVFGAKDCTQYSVATRLRKKAVEVLESGGSEL